MKKFGIRDRKIYLNLSWVDLLEEGIWILKGIDISQGTAMAKIACYVGARSYPMIQLSYSGFSSMSIVCWLSAETFFWWVQWSVIIMWQPSLWKTVFYTVLWLLSMYGNCYSCYVILECWTWKLLRFYLVKHLYPWLPGTKDPLGLS